MQILDVARLSPGQHFDDPLFHETGRKLLSRDTTLTREHLEALARSGIARVFHAESARRVLEFVRTPAETVALKDLCVGMTMETDLLTPDGVVIVQQNEQVEEHHLAALADSNIDYLILRQAADTESVRATLQAMTRQVTARVESQIRRGEYLRAPESHMPRRRALINTQELGVLNLNAVQLMRRRLTSRMQPVYGRLETGHGVDVQSLEQIVTDLFDLQASEPRQFSQLALMTQRREDHLPDHALSVAVLAMAIATEMNLSFDHVREVALGALLFDVGMLMIPKRIRTGSAALSGPDRQRVLQHPTFSISMMEQITGLSAIPRIMGYQHHERLNGSGYPAGTLMENVSDFARIVTVADIYAASTNPRMYKSQKLPYQAMEELVHMAHRGFLDVRVIKAALSAVGLFPVGSYVLLSVNATAQVVGSNGARIDRPIVTILKPDGTPDKNLVDLSSDRYAHMKIIKAVPTPTRAANN